MAIVLDKPMISENALSVTEIDARIATCMNSSFFQGIEVYGEVSGFKMSGPHAYFTLKDKDAQISCSWFSIQYKGAAFLNENGRYPKDGDSLILKCNVSFYAPSGKLSLNVISAKLNGKGALFLEFEKLKAKLMVEGLFEDSHKKEIPPYPKNVLVVTSKTGAVIRDIVTTVRRKNPVINIVVKDVRVQGEGAGKEIAKVLPKLDKLNYDVIIIARGGGSLEDLAPFYDEDLCRAVYNLVTPVISAVGHETDYSLCDFVADYRAATPTAAGEKIAYDYKEMVDSLNYAVEQLKKQTLSIFDNAFRRVQISTVKLQHLADTFYSEKMHRVELDFNFIKNSMEKKIIDAESKAQKLTLLLDSLSPLKTLSRGYFALEKNGKTIPSVKSLKVGDEISLKGKDGKVTASVTKIEENKEE